MLNDLSFLGMIYLNNIFLIVIEKGNEEGDYNVGNQTLVNNFSSSQPTSLLKFPFIPYT